MEKGIIPFRNTELLTAKNEESKEIYVALKPIIEGIGLNWKDQIVKIKNDKRFKHMLIHFSTNRGSQEMICIPYSHLPAFLYSINPNKINNDSKEILLTFQEETFGVINDYWLKGYAIKRDLNYSFPLQEELKQITPELQESVKRIFDDVKDIQVVRKIASLSPEKQKVMIKEIEFIIDSENEDEKLTEEKKTLEQEVKRLQNIEKEYKKLERERNLLLTGMKKKVQEKLEERETEIKVQYKETSKNITKVIEEERAKIQAEYKDEIETLSKELRNMSLARKKVADHTEQYKDEIKALKEKIKESNNTAVKFKNDKDYWMKLHDEATNRENLPVLIHLIRDEMRIFNKQLLKAGGTTDSNKQTITEALDEIQEILDETKDTITQLNQLPVINDN